MIAFGIGIPVFQWLAALPQPVIAAISGHALSVAGWYSPRARPIFVSQCVQLSQVWFTRSKVSGHDFRIMDGNSPLAENIVIVCQRYLTTLGGPFVVAQALDWGLVKALAVDADDLKAVERLAGKAVNAPGAMALTKRILASSDADIRQHHAAEPPRRFNRRRRGRSAPFREKVNLLSKPVKST